MNKMKCKFVKIIGFVLITFVGIGVNAATINVPADYATIQAAITAASTGDEINVAAGTYYETLNITTAGIDVIGASRATVIIDPTGLSTNNAGIYVAANNVTLKSLTLQSTVTNSLPRYGIKFGQVDGCVLEDVTVLNAYRSGIDALGTSHLTIANVSSLDNGGHGLSLVDCNYVSVTDITLGGNGWQNVSVATWGRYTPLGTSNIFFNGTNSFGDLFQLEMGDYNNPGVAPAGDAIITYSTNLIDGADVTVQASDFGFALHGTQDDSPGQERIWFFSVLANAAIVPPLAPIGHWTGEAMYIESLIDGTQLYITPGCNIQTAIDVASVGDDIHVSAGTYREQLYIDKSVNLLGSGSVDCIIEAPDAGSRSTYTITQWSGSVKTIDAVIGVNTAGTVNVDGFKIDGRDTGPGNFYGVCFFDTDASITNCIIDNVTYSAAPGTQSVVSLLATHSLGVSFTIDITGNTIPTFQKGGIVLMGPGCDFIVNDNSVTGQASSSIAGNCIQLSYGAFGSTSGNYVEGTSYTGDDWSSTGILLFESGDVSMDGDEVYNCESGVNFSDWGWVYLSPSTVTLDFANLNLHDNEWTLGVQLSRDNSNVNLSVTNSSLLNNGGDGFDLYGTGPDPWGGAYYTGWNNGNLTAVIAGCIITNALYDGIWTADLSGNANTADIDVHGCYFTGNSSSAVNNTMTQTLDATGCYWDDPTGPTVGSRSRGTRSTANLVSPYGDVLPKKAVTSTTSYNDSRGSGETVLGPVSYSPFWMANYMGDAHTSPWDWGVDVTGTIGDGIAAASDGDNITVYAGTYAEGPQVVVDKNITIAGVDRNTVTITPTANTGSSGDPRGWFLVQTGISLDLSEVTLDGAGFNIYQGIRSHGDVTLTSVDFRNIIYSKYVGLGCAVMDADLTVGDCTFENIGRIGLMAFGPGSTGNLIANCTYVGKGDGDWLDYGIEFGNGAMGVIDNCDISNNTGVAASDGSTSAGIIATTYYGPGTTVTVTNCNLHDNTQGMAVGYDASDGTTVIASDNTIVNNPSGGIASTSAVEVNAEENYWGTLSCPEISLMVGGLVDFDPWCNDDFSYCGFSCIINEVWVDDDWAGSSEGDNVGGHIFGYDAFDVIADGVDAVLDPGTVHVFDGNYDTPINIDSRSTLSILGETQAGTIFKPTSTLDWGFAPYGAGRQVAVRVFGSTGITLSNMTMDFDLIKADNTFGLLFWNSAGEISNNTLQNMNTAGYYEFISYLRAPDFTDGARAQIDILNNTFLKTGRVGIVVHDYVNTLIEGNNFDMVVDDFGYAIELGSMATGIIKDNVFSNYDTWAATDQSTVSAIYVENSFTSGVVVPLTKSVTVEGNDISNCQYGIIVGNEVPGYAGDVDIVITIEDNNISNNSTAGSLASGAIIISDEGKDAGSSINATVHNNMLLNNGDHGILINTDGNGDISTTITENIISENYTGVSVKDYATTSTSSYNIVVHHNFFDNYLNAEDDVAGGNWDDLTTNVGNCWSDWETNSGYPIHYEINGSAGTEDRRPNKEYCNEMGDCRTGEANGEEPINILDIIYLINYKYKEGPAPKPYELCSGDPNCDCVVNILDIVLLINFKYKEGPAPCGGSDWMFACKLPIRGETPAISTIFVDPIKEDISVKPEVSVDQSSEKTLTTQVVSNEIITNTKKVNSFSAFK